MLAYYSTVATSQPHNLRANTTVHAMYVYVCICMYFFYMHVFLCICMYLTSAATRHVSDELIS